MRRKTIECPRCSGHGVLVVLDNESMRRDRLAAAHGMRTAAETTVTHQPRLSPTADWVTLIVR